MTGSTDEARARHGEAEILVAKFAARLGGDESLVVICARSAAEAANRVERLCTAIANHPRRDLVLSLQVTTRASPDESGEALTCSYTVGMTGFEPATP